MITGVLIFIGGCLFGGIIGMFFGYAACIYSLHNKNKSEQ